MSIVKNQHYIPKFYLRNFSINDKNIGMFMYKENKYISNASIKSVAYSEFLYGEDGKLEHLLGKFESKWAKAIKKIIKLGLYSLIDDDFIDLCSFILISKNRTKKVADENKLLFNYLKELIPEEGIHNSNCNMSRSDFDQAMKIPNEVPIDVAIKNIDILYDLNAIVLENRTSYEYITCDSPVVFYNQFYVWRNYKINYGLACSGLQIFIPLSPKKILCLYDPEVYDCLNDEKGVVKIISKKQVTEINKLVIYNAYDLIFFCDETKESYIDELSKFKVSDNSDQLISNYESSDSNDQLIRVGKSSIHEKIKLDFFNIKRKYKTIELPNNCAGLQRKNATYIKIRNNMGM